MSKAHWIALSLTPGVGGVTARKLVEHFGSVEAVFEADADALLDVPRLTPEIVQRIQSTSLETVEAELASLEDEGIGVLTLDDDDYPPLLRTSQAAPVALFVCGCLPPDGTPSVAIVGTRQPSPSGQQAAQALARELAGRGWAIVSGLALGIDTAAHQGALSVERGCTLAVLGSGLRVIHPRQNARLAQDIARRGALLSELHPNTPPAGPQLMARNRIVSGLSRAVIVVEAGQASGSLDTAAKAHKQGRAVLAVPGSPGTDQLIAAGAARVELEPLDGSALAARLEHAIQQAAASHAEAGDKRQLSLW